MWLAAARLLVAVTMMVYRPVLPRTGIPVIVAVPFPLPVKVSPVGSGPDSDMAGTGYPVAVMTRLMAAPALARMVLVFFSAGGRVMVRVKAWVAVPDRFLAVRVSG